MRNAIRTFLHCLSMVAVLSLAWPMHAAAQAYPTKPIRLINPFPPGGPAEIISRAVMVKLTERLGQPVIIESRAGASGSIASAAVAQAAPDGYTLLIGDLSPLVINPATRNDMPYDTLRDFEPVTQMVSGTLVLVVRGDLPVKNLQDLVAYAKANPGKVSYGSAGTGTTTHLSGEMLEMTAKVDMNHIPYKGGAPVITDLLGGQIDASFLNIAGLQPHFDSGKLRPLAVSTPKRSPLLPNVPAVAETFNGFDASSWYGVVAPAKTPKDIIAKLEREIRDILKQPDIVEFMNARGLSVEGSTSEEYRQRIREDITKWRAVVQAAGLAPKN